MSNEKAVAWAALQAAASTHASVGTKETGQVLSDAAKAWGLATGQRPPAAPRVVGDGDVLVPFGRQKGQPISACEVKDLEWLAQALLKSIGDPDKARWKDDNQRLVDAIEAEIERR